MQKRWLQVAKSTHSKTRLIGKSLPEGNIGGSLLRNHYVIRRSFDRQQYLYERYSRMHYAKLQTECKKQ